MYYEITHDNKNKRIIQIFEGHGKFNKKETGGQTLLYDASYHDMLLRYHISERLKEKEIKIICHNKKKKIRSTI